MKNKMKKNAENMNKWKSPKNEDFKKGQFEIVSQSKLFVKPEAPPVIRGRVVENLRRDAYNSLKEGEDEETLVTGKVYVKEAKKSKWKSLKPIVDTKPRARSRSPTYRKRDYKYVQKLFF